MKIESLSVFRGLSSICIALTCTVALTTITGFAADPVINPGGLVEAAGYSARFTAGSIVSLFGANLASTTSGASTLPREFSGQNFRYDGHNGPTAAWQRAVRRPFPWPALSLSCLFLCPLLFKIPVRSCTMWTSQGRGSGSFQGAPITPLLRHSTPRRSR